MGGGMTGSTNHQRAWTPERDEQLRQHVADRRSATEAATLIGVTRNSAIGRASRIGLQFKSEKPQTLNFSMRHTRPKTAPKPVPVSAPDAPPSLDLSIEALSDATCRYPEGNAAPYSYCGQATRPSSPYCQHHHSLCLSKPSVIWGTR
jgi:hypothetical protein